MKHAGLVPMSLVFAPLAGGLLVAPVRAQEPEIPQVDLDMPFVLDAEEMMRVGPEGFEVTLRTISEASGCLAPNDYSVTLLKGTLAMRLGEKRNLTQLDASLKPDSPTDLDFVGNRLWVTAVNRIKGRLEAAFKVVKVVKAEEKKADAEGEP